MFAATEHLFKDLNDNQKKAVRETEGRILVLAGAGAGKTKVLTTRTAYLLEQGIEPWRILAITFTNKAAKEMKERVHKINNQSYKCWIGTFHSMCSRILSAHAHLLGIQKFTHIDDSDQRVLIKTAAKQLGLEVDKNMVTSLHSKISLWKSDMIAPGEAQSMNHHNKDELNAAYVYQRYEELKEAHFYYDFDDLLLKTVLLFWNHPMLLERYQNTFQYVMVDEFQDTNKVQFELIELLTRKNGNLFLVGDADQSIYSFRAAKIENILRYQELHPETKLFTLEENYRSTQTIVNASNALVSHNKMRLERKAYSIGETGDDIHIFRFNDASREADFVTRLILNIKKSEQLDWKDFAILYRNNFQSKQLELALKDENIPYQIIGSISFYERKEIKELVSYLRACHNTNDDLAIKHIINVPKRSIGDTTIKKIELFAEGRKIPFFTALQNIEEIANISKINKNTVIKIQDFVCLLNFLSKKALDNPFSAAGFLKLILQKTGFIEQFDFEKEEDAARIENISYLKDHAREWDLDEEKEQNTLAQFLSEVMLEGDKEEIEDENRVTLITVHSAKGLEFPQIFLVGLEDGIFPSFRTKGNEADLEEERRLFYVAMTRAAKRLFLSYSAYKFEFGSQKAIKQKPSPFLNEIPKSYKRMYIQKK